MDPTPASSTSSRCGMCGSCGTMPPWAPEMLKNASPEARLALERRMQQAQRRFIEERDARSKEQLELHIAWRASDSQSDDESQLGVNDPVMLPNDDTSQRIYNGNEEEQVVEPFSQLILEELIEEKDKYPVSSNDASREPQTGANAERGIGAPTHSVPAVSEDEVEGDANVEIPLDNTGIPPLPPADRNEHQAEPSILHPQSLDVLQPPRRKLPQLYSPALVESPVPSSTPELQALPDVSLEQNQPSEPLRTISLRDAESDADSFHTAQGDELVQLSSDDLSLKSREELDNNVAPIVSETEWQAFQDGEDVAASGPEVAASNAARPSVSESPVTSTEDSASLEGHTRDATNAEHSSSKTEIFDAHPSENLEGFVTKGHSTDLGPSSPQAQRQAIVDDYALPADLVQPNEIEIESQSCQDCERWRERVRELELKVEALTSALDAREMESASMRARAGDRRYHGKNEAQLIEECESLRITTEYLYYKLERYEKKLNGSHPEVH